MIRDREGRSYLLRYCCCHYKQATLITARQALRLVVHNSLDFGLLSESWSVSQFCLNPCTLGLVEAGVI